MIFREDETCRLDVYITNNIKELSRNAVQNLIEEGNVTVNGKTKKSNYKLQKEDIISVELKQPVELEILPEHMPLNILYEDSELIVLNKPQGVVVHPSAGHYSQTLVNGLLYHCKGNLSGINGVLRPGIVHRIDKDTSGILVVAKTNTAHMLLSKQLENHEMTRKYNAIVKGNVKNDSGTINKPIGRHKKDRKKMAVDEANGKKAITHYKVLERFGKYTFIEAVLETGRTHQIRVHFSSIGHSLLGDETYGKIFESKKIKLCGQVLHAKVLGFIHPTTNEYMEFETSLPPYFLELLEYLRS